MTTHITNYNLNKSKKTTFENCTLFEDLNNYDKPPVLVLSGSSYEKGFAYGKLMHSKITESISRVCTQVYALKGGWKVDGTTKPTLEEINKGKLIVQNRIYKDIVPAIISKVPETWTQINGLYDGLKDSGSPIDFDDLLAWNTAPESFSNSKGCSNFAVWNDSTIDKKLYHGITMDYDTFGILHKNVVLIVEKNHDFNDFIGVTFIGMISPNSFINESGVSLGEMTSSSVLEAWPQISHFIQVKKIATEANNISDAYNIIKKTGGTTGFLHMVCQTKPFTDSAVIETAGALTGIRRAISAIPNAIYATNHFHAYPGLEGYEGPNLVEGQIEKWSTNEKLVKKQFGLDNLSWENVDTIGKWKKLMKTDRIDAYEKYLSDNDGSFSLNNIIELHSQQPICNSGDTLADEIIMAPKCRHLYDLEFPITNRIHMRSLYCCVIVPEDHTLYIAAGNEPAQSGTFYKISLDDPNLE